MIYKTLIQARATTKDYFKILNRIKKYSLKKYYKDLNVYTNFGISFRIWKKKNLYLYSYVIKKDKNYE